MLDIFEEVHAFNPIATMLFRKLRNLSGPNDQLIFGFLIICNEDGEEELDFTLEDYNYILSKMNDLKYRPKRCNNVEWEQLLRADKLIMRLSKTSLLVCLLYTSPSPRD